MTIDRRQGISAALFILVLLAFLAPWVSLSCGGTTIEVTGRELIVGKIDSDPALGIDSSTAEAEPEPLAIAALLTAVVGGFLTGLTGQAGRLARAGAGLLGAGLLIALRIDIAREIEEALQGQSGIAVVGWEFGWWLAVACFALVVPAQAVALSGDEHGWRLPPPSGGGSPPESREQPASESRVEGVVVIREDRGVAIALGGMALVVLSMGFNWAQFAPGFALDLGPVLLGLAAATVAVVVVLDLLATQVRMEYANRLLGLSGLAAAAIVLVETVRLLTDGRDPAWGLGLAVLGAGAWCAVGVARGWPQAVSSLQAASSTHGSGAAASAPCPACNASLPAGTRFCPSCGRNVEVVRSTAPSPACHNCGSMLAVGLKFCTQCGQAARAEA